MLKIKRQSRVPLRLARLIAGLMLFGVLVIQPMEVHSQDIGQDFGNIVNDILGNSTKDAGNVAKGILHGVEHTFNKTLKDITGNVISGLANCVAQDFNGVVDATNFFINQSGQYFFLTSAGLINLVQHGDLPKVRDITVAEYQWANAVLYHNTLPQIDKIKIFNFSKLDDQSHRFFTWPGVNQYIYMNLGDDGGFDHPMTYSSGSYTQPGEVFIHELAHAWQIGHYGREAMITRYFASGGNSHSSYKPDCSKGVNGSFPIEAEATMVDRTYANYYFGYKDSDYCDFQQKWVENNVLGGNSLDMLTADTQMRQHVQNFMQFFGSIPYDLPAHTTGSRVGGEGYFLLGSVPWSVLYYPLKYKTAYANWGEIRKKYNSLGAEHGVLGWPQTDIGNLRDSGSFQRFEGGLIYSTPRGTFYMSLTPIINTYGANNWEKGRLGYPISDFIPDPFGRVGVISGVQKFEHGIIKYNSAEGNPVVVLDFLANQLSPITNSQPQTQNKNISSPVPTKINQQPLLPKKK